MLVLGGIAAAVALNGGADTTAGEPAASPSPKRSLAAEPACRPQGVGGRVHGEADVADGHRGRGARRSLRHHAWRKDRRAADGDATSFLDDTALPKQSYDYQVIAISAEGTRLGDSVSAETPGAPPGTATLAGVFNVKVHPTSHSGFSSFDEKDRTAGWRFVPSCKQPPCDTQLRDLGIKDFQIQLKRTEGTYTGTASVSGLVSCGGHDVSTSITVTIHATQADAVGEGWRITKFTGTMSQYSSSQLGCTSSSARFDVTGTLTKG